MFGFSRERNTYHYGSDTYKYINNMIKYSQRVQIVSPYIDEYYANMIAKNSPKTEFYIISSSLDQDAKNILMRKSSKTIIFIAGALSLFALFGLIFDGISGYPLVISAIPLILGLSRYAAKAKRAKRIHVKIPKRFVHAKMYISENQAILGSVNLTYKGTHSNVEHIDITRDSDELYKLREQFWDIWGTY